MMRRPQPGVRSRVSRAIRPCLATLVVAAPAFPSPASADLTRLDLARVGLAPPPGARVPLDLELRTDGGQSITVAAALDGRPTLLVPIDPNCRVICAPTLAILSGALMGTGLRPGRDVRLVVIGLGPRDEARTSVTAGIDGALAEAVTTVTGPPEAVARLTEAIGYTSVPDTVHGAIVHPAAFVSLTGDGRVSRVLSSLTVTADSLRLALVEAGEGRIGTLGDRVRLLCYGFDAAQGIYTPRIWQALQAAIGLTLLGLAGGLILLHRRATAKP